MAVKILISLIQVGVHNENHYSCAYDLALMGRYAMKNEIFRKIVSTSRYTLPATNKYDKTDRTFATTNKLINSKSSQFYKYATGIKTGFTDPAKNCIVASSKKDDFELICVILGNENDSNSNNKFNDCINLFNYGFSNYSYKKLYEKDSIYKVVNPSNASSETKELNLIVENDVSVLMKISDDSSSLTPTVNLDNLKAPITKGSVVGSISYDVARY